MHAPEKRGFFNDFDCCAFVKAPRYLSQKIDHKASLLTVTLLLLRLQL
jgi:hypothetical protein